MLSPRIALVLLLLINLFNYVDRQVLAAVEPRIASELGVGMTRMGLLSTAFLLAYMLLAPIFGFLADRFSRWVLVGVGVILWSLASGASGLAGTFTALLITRCFVGVGEAAYGPVAPALLSDLYPVEKRGQILAWFYMAIPVGSALGYVLGGLVGGTWGWRWAFYVVVPPGILLGLWALSMRQPQAAGAKQRADRPGKRASWPQYVSLLRNRSYLLDTAGMTAMTFAIGGVSFWIPRYIAEFRHAASLEKVNLIFGGIVVANGLLATLAGGWAGDKLRARYPGSYFLVSAAGLAAAFPCFVLMMLTPFPLAWVFISLAVFCLFFNTGPSNAILANVTGPNIRASAFALNILVIHLFGDAVSPPIIGAISEHFGTMNAGFGAVAILLLVGSAFWFAGAQYLQRDTAAAQAEELAV